MGQKKVIIDTNVLISALGWGGKAREVVDLGFSASFQWFISKPLLEELVATLNYQKFDTVNSDNKEKFIYAVSAAGQLVEFEQEIKRGFVDPKDEMFLDLALEVDADYLVSGDKHLLDLKSIGRTKIVNPAGFLPLFKNQ